MYILKKSGPKKGLWGTPASIGEQEHAWLFKRTRWYQPLKKLWIRLKSVPEIPID